MNRSIKGETVLLTPSSNTKEEQLQEIYKAYAVDPVFNDLRELGGNFVPGHGPVNAKVMLVGLNPGKLENDNKRPFAGKNGKNLAALFEDTGYHVQQTYRTELVKYWPKSAYPKKRELTRAEIRASLEYLKQEIECINPRFVGLMGRTVLNAFYPDLNQVYPVLGTVIDDLYVPLHDPSYIMHRPNKWNIVRSGYEKIAKLALEN